ncbi:MAG TPA: hypothetical protein VG844_04460 [Terracidiphilus sp.]|nr:hypothetical protein [Terracidiphilus sp.]
MGLCPGKFSGKQSRDQAIFIAENSFGCIEPTIKECSVQFSRKYSHWGVTEVLRDEWSEIIPKLKILKEEAMRASSPEELLKVLSPSEVFESEFNLHFVMNRNGLCALIDQLLPWVEKTLHEDDSVSILGV